jgi:hypothetical protein
LITVGSSLKQFKLEPYHSQVVAIIVCADLVIESICLIHGIKRNVLYNFVMLYEFWLYAYYFLQLIHSRHAQLLIRIFLCIIPVGWVWLVLVKGDVSVWNTNFHAAGSVMVVLLCAWNYYELFTSEKLERLSVSFEFWIATALTFYFACNFPFLVLVNYVARSSLPLAGKMMVGLQILNIVFYLIVCYAFICLRRQKKLLSL